jgi:hypothetical protein
MCGLILDTFVMYGVIAMVSGERPDDYLTPLLVSFGFSLTMAACAAFLPVVWFFVALVPLVILFGVLLSSLFGMPLKRAILGAAIFLVYKVLFEIAWAFLLA